MDDRIYKNDLKSKSAIELLMENLERAFERGDIDDKEYDRQMDELIKYNI